MKCLITGAAGFIGSHLADRLLAEGHTVVGIDNFITGNKRNIEHLSGNKAFSFLEHDVTNPIPSGIAADIVFHFASPASPPKYQLYPVETLLVNTQGTYQLLQKATEWRIPFVFASTSEIYGEPLEHPQKETYFGNVNTIGPRSCYDEAKRCGETLVAVFRQKFGIDGRIIRIFNTYGPRMDIDDGRVITNFIKELRAGRPLPIQGIGNQTRSFCFVSDLVDGVVRVGFDEKAKNEVFNLGNPDELTILELAQLIQTLMHKDYGVINKPLPQDDPTRRKPDIGKAKAILGWKPHISLEEGLSQTIASLKQV